MTEGGALQNDRGGVLKMTEGGALQNDRGGVLKMTEGGALQNDRGKESSERQWQGVLKND